jgi:hypothetical protein
MHRCQADRLLLLQLPWLPLSRQAALLLLLPWVCWVLC